MTEQNLPHVMERLRVLLGGAVQRNLADCILLSGGLDISILTTVASEHTKLTGITVSLGDAPDVKFASSIAEKFGLRHSIVRIDNGDIELVIREVVRVMQSFDPMEIRNDATILVGLRNAKQAALTQS